MKPVRGILLDIDGTLVDSNDAHARAWVKALAESGHTVALEAVRPLIGMGGDKLLPKVCGLEAESDGGKRVSERRGEMFLKEYLPHLKPTRRERAVGVAPGAEVPIGHAEFGKEGRTPPATQGLRGRSSDRGRHLVRRRGGVET